MSGMHTIGGLAMAPRIGSIRGMEIRLHLSLLVLVAFWLFQGLSHGPGGITYVLVLTGSIFGVILWHELGHAMAARHCGLRVHGILLWPLGGECQIAGGMPSPRAELITAMAGPAAHALLIVITFALLAILAPHLVGVPVVDPGVGALRAAWSLACYILFFNLIPAFPLDGGRALRALLTFRLGDIRATVIAARLGQALWILALLLVVITGRGGMMLLMLGMYMIFQAEQELQAARFIGYVYDPGAGAFFGGADWSRRSVENYGRGEQPGLWRRLVTAWHLRRLARETSRRENLRAEVDRILEKVSREGMPSLTARERHTLKQASSEYRR